MDAESWGSNLRYSVQPSDYINDLRFYDKHRESLSNKSKVCRGGLRNGNVAVFVYAAGLVAG